MMQRLKTRRWSFIFAFASIYFIWGSTYLAIRIAVETIPPFIMLASRFGLAGLILYAYLRLSGLARPTFAQWRSAFVVGGLMLGGGTGALAWSEQFVSSGLAALLVTTAPLWMVILDWLWAGNERPRAVTLTGISVGFLGVIVLVDPIGVLSNVQVDYVAAFVVVVGALSWSLGSLRSRDSNLPANPFLAASMQMISGGIFLTVVAIVSGELNAIDIASISRPSFISWAYLFLFGSFIPFNAYIWLMRNTTPAAVSTYAFVNPIVAVFLGWAFAGEAVTTNVAIAIALLVAAVILITQQGRRLAVTRRASPPLICYELDESNKLVEAHSVADSREKTTDSRSALAI